MKRLDLRAFVTLGLISLLVYWKILLTHQYSLLTGYEGANQAYAWYGFIASSIKHGHWPLWDPYTFAGRSFAGEMQTGAFYPLNLLLAAAPFNKHGMFSPALYHWLFALTHLLGAWFMFALVRSLGLGYFASLLGGVCFSFGGVMARLGGWPHMLQSGIWLPLICLLAFHGLKAPTRGHALAYSALGGLSLGLSILGGGLHFVLMQGIVVITVSAAHLGQASWKRCGLVAAVILTMGATSGAVQLLPSMEYGRLALRHLGSGAIGAAEKIPYWQLNDGLMPNGVLSLLFGAPAGQLAFGEYLNPYLGVLPLLLAGVGIWKCWESSWVRGFAALAGAAIFYSLGFLSLLHGLAYALVPFLWMAREAGRFLYLADFSLAILAAFGVERLFKLSSGESAPLKKLLVRLLALCALVLAVPAVFGKPEIGPWVGVSLLIMIASFGLALWILSGHRGRGVRFLVLSLVLCDLYAFDWGALNLAQASAKSSDELERLTSLEGAARFLKSKGGPFRVQMAMNAPPNAGDAFGIQTTWGAGVTLLKNYDRARSLTSLFNVRYTIRPASAGEPGAVYQDASWKIYENPAAGPRAWLVHETSVEESPDFDPRKRALLARPLETALDPAGDPAAESVNIDGYRPDAIELSVKTQGRALLVLSEVYYPGWQATVNGRKEAIVEVDRALRGVPVPSGESRVVLAYQPGSVAAGAALTLISFCLLPVALLWLRRRPTPDGSSALPW